MATYLIFVPLPDDRADLAERLVRSAVCFFEAQGVVPKRADVGSFHRGARGGGAEMLKLVALTADGGLDADDVARTLEGVLRSTLTVAKVRAGDLRVYVGSASVAPAERGGTSAG